MSNRNHRIRAFTGPGAKQKAERVGNWFKALGGNAKAQAWCIDEGIALTKASGESVGTIGAFLAPQDFDTAIIAVREAMGAFRQGCEIRPTSSDNQVRPRRFAGVTANFVAENTPIPESSLELDAVQTTQRKLAVLVRGSSELFEDSAPDLGEYLTSEIGYAFAIQEDNCGFNGDGTSTYGRITGLANKLPGMASAITAASGHNTFLTLDSTDITNLMAGVMAAAVPGACWYTGMIGYAQTLCRLAAASGGLTATQRADGTISANYLGFPVRFSGKLPDISTTLSGKPMLYFGDLRMSSVLVERQQQTVIAISRDRAMDTDQVLVRGVQRCDINNHYFGDAATRGPIAMLVGG